jgi:hypothetical protein
LDNPFYQDLNLNSCTLAERTPSIRIVFDVTPKGFGSLASPLVVMPFAVKMAIASGGKNGH